MSARRLIAAALTGICCYSAVATAHAGGGGAQEGLQTPTSVDGLASRWLVIERAGRGGRVPIHTDAIEAAVVAGEWAAPRAGDAVRVSDDEEKTWQEAAPGDNGWLEHEALLGSYACLIVESPTERVMLLDAAGHSMVYVNGCPRVGDTYSTGWVLLPVKLEAGTNTFLFHVGRGRVRAKLVEAKSRLMFVGDDIDATDEKAAYRRPRDLTLPDIIRGEDGVVWGAVPVINATDTPATGLFIDATLGKPEPTRTALPVIPPMSVRKVGFWMEAPEDLSVDRLDFHLRLYATGDNGKTLTDEAIIGVRVRNPLDKHKRTFISEIDGSVQYFAVTPRHAEVGDESAPALFLSLHGASVEATGQANAYKHKTQGTLVAPTNRRPYGFDWEDWGRVDAREVLEIAKRIWRPDERRIYLTGHSMGGHGAWTVGATFPDQFAAIGPSAAWPEFASYGGSAVYEDPTPIEQILDRAVSASHTLKLERNYLHHGVYVLHGDKDDNVPVSLARMMRKRLAEFHPDFAYYEEPGAGHWWGDRCVDWGPMFDFFMYHTRPEPAEVTHVEFYTACPSVSASCHWATIEAQTHMLQTSSVDIRLDPKERKFVGKTENVARLMLDLSELSRSRTRETKEGAVDATTMAAGEPLTVELDGQELEGIEWPRGEARVWLGRRDEAWGVIAKPEPFEKGPQRYGPFKQAFYNRFVFVCGTRGSSEAAAINYAKARYDAETFWYRGNGSVDVVADVDFDVSQEPDRSVILYGNADTNAAWAGLLGESPLQVRDGAIEVGQREILGDELACLFIRPRPGSEWALVGVVSGSGLAGMRLTERLPYFLAGVAYPDWIVLGADILEVGTEGVVGAGFFGLDWSVEGGDFAWR